jgi:hypothetical protein
MFERKIYTEFKSWSQHSKDTVLLVTGARQIGKSYLVERLAREEYKHRVVINLFQNKEAKAALSEANNVADLISRISLFADDALVPGETLIFIDEIQELPDIITMAKFLVQDGRFSYAFSGSLLGTELKGVRSYPVGFVTEIQMHPMDFWEFCCAVGVSEETLGTLKQACVSLTPLPDYLHQHLLTYFRTYAVVGGMPAVVQAYLDSQADLSRVLAVQADLSRSYVADITKYAGKLAPDVRAIYEQLPLQLDSKTGRFKLNSLEQGARYEKYSLDFNWLVSAGVALKCNVVRDPKHPLGLSQDARTFKLYQSDTGILVSRYGVQMARDIYLDSQAPNVGCVYENIFAQELAARNIQLFYYMNKKRGEVDFICENEKGQVVPIEIKSGRTPRAHTSLTSLMQRTDADIPAGYVLSRLNFETNGNIHYIPWYATAFLEEIIEVKPSIQNGDSITLALPSI